MPRWLRILFFASLLGIWAIGLWFIWTKMPVGPHEGWQPRQGEHPVAIHPDGNTVLVAQQNSDRPNETTWCARKLDSGMLLFQFKQTQIQDQFPGFIRNHGGFFQMGNWLILYDVLKNEESKYLGIIQIYNASTGVKLRDYVVPLRIVSDTDWFIISGNGQWLVLLKENTLEIRDLATNQLVRTFPNSALDGLPACCFSDNSAFLAMRNKSGIAIHDLAHPNICRSQILSTVSPRAISSDGSLLIDEDYQVWDVPRAKCKYSIKAVENGMISLAAFSENGMHILVVSIEPRNGVWFTYLDAATGIPLPKRQIQLISGETQFVCISRGGAQKKWLVISNSVSTRPAFASKSLITNWKQWLGNVPGFSRLLGSTEIGQHVVYDLEFDSIVSHGSSTQASAFRNADYLSSISGFDVHIWNIPHRKPVRLMCMLSLIWSSFFILPMLVRSICRWIQCKETRHVPQAPRQIALTAEHAKPANVP